MTVDVTKVMECPFCGSRNTGCEVLDDGYKFVEVCRTCKARGPVYRTMPEAWKGWNARYDDGLKADVRKFVRDVCKVDRINYMAIEDLQRYADGLLAKLDAGEVI